MTAVIFCYILFTVIEDMHIILNNSSMVPIYEQLMTAVKNDIISGALCEGECLPSVRALSNELKISALTVKKAYDKLEEEGFVVTVHGKGTYVASANRELAEQARKMEAENDMAAAVEKAKIAGLTDDDIRELLEILLESLGAENTAE